MQLFRLAAGNAEVHSLDGRSSAPLLKFPATEVRRPPPHPVLRTIAAPLCVNYLRNVLHSQYANPLHPAGGLPHGPVAQRRRHRRRRVRRRHRCGARRRQHIAACLAPDPAPRGGRAALLGSAARPLHRVHNATVLAEQNTIKHQKSRPRTQYSTAKHSKAQTLVVALNPKPALKQLRR